MASSSLPSTSNHWKWKYDVFLSFRGEDTRKNFTDHLYSALIQSGILTFRDDERLARGNEIKSELFRAIEESMFSIIVLSKNFVYSTWCLDELTKIVECIKEKQHTAYPVFYGVDPSQVRKQTGNFKKAFDKHEEQNKEKVEKWRSAITQVANLSGWNVQDRYESKLIQEIVNEISKKLEHIFPRVFKNLVGVKSRVNELISDYLEVGMDDVRFVGICGMGGIGKTTIARVVYEMLSDQYDYSCFLANVREVTEKKGLESLQQKLLSGIPKGNKINICDVHDGINLIKKWLCRQKVFLILDDVDNSEQLKVLAEEHDWFGSGSRIIITTRNKHLLTSHGVKDIHVYKVEALNDHEALQLLHLKAFKHKSYTDDHFELSRSITNYIKGLPLALDVFGSFLCDRSVEEWADALDRLQEHSKDKILKVLRISYDGLENTEKQAFLDIACFFVGKKEDRVKDILSHCGFFPHLEFKVLIEKSLITISDKNICMHDLLRVMGWEIVREQHPNKPGEWSRLWLCKDICHVLKENKGSHAVEGIIQDHPKRGITYLTGKSFANMNNLRLLEISNFHFSEDLEYLSNELKFLKWRGYSLNSLPPSFHPENLFELNMCYSNIKYLWEGRKCFEQLKTIKLCYSSKLIRTPDFTEAPNIERLDLQGCTNLLEVHQSLGFLERLTVLNLKNCKNLVSFPSNVCGLKSLKILNLFGCSKLDRLPQNLGEVECLEVLDLSKTAIRQVPSSIVLLTNLKTLSFHGCRGQPPQTWSIFFPSFFFPKRNNSDLMCSLLQSLTRLPFLETLDLSDCNLLDETIPRDLGSLSSLENLNLSRNNFVSLPESINQLLKLKCLSLANCQRLQSLPVLPPEISFVGVENCASLGFETLSSAIKLNTSEDLKLHFLNCLPAENQDRIDNLTFILLKRFFQESNPHTHFHILIPGSEIPEWLSPQSSKTSIKIPLPSSWLDRFIGFAVCAVFEIPADSSDQFSWCIECKFKFRRTEFFVRVWNPCFACMKSDHLWLHFVPRRMLEADVRSNESPLQLLRDEKYFCASFNVSGRSKETMIEMIPCSVKRSGIRLVYEQECEYVGLHRNYGGLSTVESSMVELSDDELEDGLFTRGAIMATTETCRLRMFYDGDPPNWNVGHHSR